MTDEIPFLILRFDTQPALLEAGSPDDYMYETTGRIVSVNDVEESKEPGRETPEQESLVGKFRLYYADIDNACNEDVAPRDVFDTHGATFDYWDPIYGPDGTEFNEELLRLFNFDVFGNNLLMLDRLEILPPYRGQRLGLIILRRLIERFSPGAGVVAMKPFPLQFESDRSTEPERKWRSEMQLSLFSRNQRDATERLRKYYRRLGFFEMKNTPVMCKPTAWELPGIETLMA